MKRYCSLIAALTMCVPVLNAETTVTLAEFGADPSFYTQVPVLSSTDPLNGKLAMQIDSRLNYLGTSITLANFTNGLADLDITQVPADYPGQATPAVSMFWDIRIGSDNVNLNEVRLYNGNGGDQDVRTYPNCDVYVTSAVPPVSAGLWTKVAANARAFAPPANADYGFQMPGGAGPWFGGIQIKDNVGGRIASGVTGLRVDVYAGGFGLDVRDPVGTDGAVQCPFISEIDAEFISAAAVGEWSVY
ncbi:MAG: hypothetical protein WCK47_07940 [bacterium]|nr:hypothetical protein [Candidatus Sumerlaeota bacterium]